MHYHRYEYTYSSFPESICPRHDKKILSIALTHGIPHAKADDVFYACMDTIIENTLDILLSILVLSL